MQGKVLFLQKCLMTGFVLSMPFCVLGTTSDLAYAAEESSQAQASPEDLFGEEEEEGVSGGGESVAAAAVEIEETRKMEPTPEVKATAPSMDNGRVTLDFKNADIRNVLRIISLKSGMNIIAGSEVEGPVTIRLVNVPWEKALEAVLRTYGYAYEKDGNIIRVTTVDNLASEELETEVFPLKYAKAEEIRGTLEEMLSDRGTIRADTRTNVLIVTDVPTNIYKIRQVIKRIDTITPQVLIEAKIVEMTLGDIDRIGVRWNLEAALSGGSRPTTFPFQARRGIDESVNRFFPAGRGAETATTSLEGASGVSTGTTTDFPSATTALGDPLPVFPIADLENFSFGTLDFSELQILLQIIQSRSNSKVLSEPRITVLNNQEASILVGEILAVPVFERNETTGRMEVTGYDERELGIGLQVLPQINSEDQIDVTLHPAITSLIGFDQLTADIVAPRFATRDAQTKVRVRNGETIVVGGLIKEDIVDTQNKVPILGDLPLIKSLFTHMERTVNKTDLLFLITVTIIDEPDVSVEMEEAT